MQRREFIGSALAAGSLATPLRGASRPNFLFMIADDLTYRAIHSLNNPEVQTPSLDRLMRRGCTFTHCFHNGSWTGAVCVPSRVDRGGVRPQPHHVEQRAHLVPRQEGHQSDAAVGRDAGKCRLRHPHGG
ncbi:exported hypothetical protein [Candidatus Sulfopaludibacter sp. SbA3]|nr:exported hypothetical protein [Candidatus Sulfopaludibacter sp. SbA3]